MTKIFSILCFAAMAFYSGNSYSQAFHENFEIADSVFATSIGSGTWALNDRLQTSGVYSDSGSIVSPGDNLTLTTIPFSTVGMNGIILSFNHIAKIEFFDAATIEVSPDNGVSWFELCMEYFSSTSNFLSQACRFHEASYGNWEPGVPSLADNSWWRNELFDVSLLLYNSPNAMVRFKLNDSNNSGSAGRPGWFVDDIRVDSGIQFGLGGVKGKIFYDLNSNSVLDSGDAAAKNRIIQDTVSGRYSFSSYAGNYVMPVDDSTAYHVVPPSYNLFTNVPAFHSGFIGTTFQIDSMRNFALQPTAIINELLVDLTPMNSFRTGMSSIYRMTYANEGTTILNPTIIFYPDSDLTFISANLSPSIITSDSVVWNMGTLLPFETGMILIYVQVDGGLSIGTGIISSAVIEPVAGDVNILNNQSISSEVTVGSFDPNDIVVDRDTVFDYELSAPPFLEYLIRFQNTGNDTAFVVIIANDISEMLDLSTFELVASSHDVVLNYSNGLERMEFYFTDIMLPDSNVNEPLSHGFVKYRIKPLSTLIAGDIIYNTADIYFDFNLPVATNTVQTHIVTSTGLNDVIVSNEGIKVFPNPVNEQLNILIEDRKDQQIVLEICNVFGQRIKSLFEGEVTSDKMQIISETSSFSDGLYFLRLNSDSKSTVHRFVKM